LEYGYSADIGIYIIKMSTSKISALTILILLNLFVSSLAFSNAIFYCGFSGDYCGQSKKDDVHPSIQTIILAFANTAPDGRIVID
jgi:hypothetical protein